MNAQNKLTPTKKIRSILGNQYGMLRTSDLEKSKIPRSYLSLLQEKGEIERVSRGVYKAVDTIEDEFFTFQARYKSSYFSHETALYLHDLTDRTPLFYSVSVPISYHSTSLIKSRHKIFYIQDDLFDLGVILLKSPHGNEIKSTNLERTLVDTIRSRKKMDAQIVNHAIREYAKRKDKNINLLYSYAEKFRVQKIIRQYIEILL